MFNGLKHIFREIPKQAPEADFDMRDVTDPIQYLVNTIVDISDVSGYDVSKWTIGDLNRFIEATVRFGGKK